MKLTLLLFVSALQLIIFQSQAQHELWGMTYSGGASHYLGTIFKTQADGTNLEVQYNFTTNFSGAHPAATLTEANNGMLYGMTYNGGAKNKGVLFEFNPSTGAYTWKLDFDGGLNGGLPTGSLTKAANGNLYGFTGAGGVNNLGVLFEFNPSTSQFTKKIDIATSTGSNPQGSLVLSTNGKMYGLTQGGGANNQGTLVEYDPATNTYASKIDFNGTNGANPQGNDLVEASNGKLYGMTLGGGTNGMGTLFEYDPTTNTLAKKLDFNGSLNGATPRGSLVQHANGKLYGMTWAGGTGDKGVIFEFDPVSFSYQKKVDFTGPENGQIPGGSLAKGANGKLYGMTSIGGFGDGNGFGILFEYDPLTNVFVGKKSFNDQSGFAPQGSLMLSSNGNFYGMLTNGGANDDGTLFEYNTSTQTFTKKIDFGFAPGGSNPTGNLTSAPNGKFYGLTGNGGVNGYGVLFEFDPVTKIYTKKFDFDGADHGDMPVGSLSLSPDNKLYGMTYRGGAFGKGTLFEYDYSTGDLERKISFNGTDTGGFPYGTLTVAANDKLYGLTYIGGANQGGVIFEYNPATSSFLKKYDFAPVTGAYPQGTLTEASNGKLYGVTQGGGTHDAGVIFEFDPSTAAYVRKFDFDAATSGSSPYAGLMEASNNKLYGMTAFGGTDNRGVLYEFDLSTNTYTKKVNFDFFTYGANPSGVLTESSNGKLYGLSAIGGTTEAGVLFEYDPALNTLLSKQSFDGTNGAYPQSGASLVYTKSNQTITFNTLPSKTYGNSAFELTGSASSGLPVTYSSLDPEIASINNNIVTIHKAGTVAIRAHQKGNHLYYRAPNVLQMLTINKAMLTVTAGNQTKTYGANNPEFTFVYSGFIGSDNQTVIDTPPNASCAATQFSSTGSYPITLSGGIDGNYSFSLVSGNLEITKASLTITAENKTRPYGTANPAFTLSYTGLLGSDNPDVLDALPSSSTLADESSGVGTYPIILAGGTDNNYAFTLVNGTLTVAKAVLTVTGGNRTKTYGTNNPEFTFTYSGFVGSEDQTIIDTPPDIGCAATQFSNTGNYPITLSGGIDGNYSFSFVSGNLEITKAMLTVTAGNQAKTYGANNPEFTFVYSGFIGSDNQTVIDTPPNASCAATQFSSTGSYPITLSGGIDGNYSFSFVSGNLEITKASLTITAENKTRPYGTANPAFTLSYTGLLGSDNPDVLDALPSSSTLADESSGVGTYPIVLAGGTDNNYAFTLVNGTLTVIKADQTIQFNSIADRLISASPFTLTATATSGLPIVYSSDSDKITFAGNSATLKNPGRVTIIASQPGNESYQAAQSVSQGFCILPAKPAITSSTGAGGYPTLTSSAANGNQWYYNNNLIAWATSNSLDVIFSGSYKVQVKIDDCSSEFSDALPVVITGDVSHHGEVVLYPNPTSDYVYVTGLSKNINGAYLIDPTGRPHSLSWAYDREAFKADISTLPAGAYLLKINHRDEILTLKVMKR